jgi:hypothetical protein
MKPNTMKAIAAAQALIANVPNKMDTTPAIAAPHITVFIRNIMPPPQSLSSLIIPPIPPNSKRGLLTRLPSRE